MHCSDINTIDARNRPVTSSCHVLYLYASFKSTSNQSRMDEQTNRPRDRQGAFLWHTALFDYFLIALYYLLQFYRSQRTCIHIDYSGYLNDYVCTSDTHFICSHNQNDRKFSSQRIIFIPQWKFWSKQFGHNDFTLRQRQISIDS